VFDKLISHTNRLDSLWIIYIYILFRLYYKNIVI